MDVLLLGHSPGQKREGSWTERETTVKAGDAEADFLGECKPGPAEGSEAARSQGPGLSCTSPSRRIGGHVDPPNGTRPRGTLRPRQSSAKPQPTLAHGDPAPRLRDPDTFESPALGPLAEPPPQPLSLATISVT